MGLVQGGMIHIGSHSTTAASNSLALSDGLACYTGSFSGVTSTSITHSLGSTDLLIEFKDSAGNLLVPDNWQITNPNVISADFSPAATGDVTIVACIESGLAPIRAGVLILEGLSGVIDLDSPNGSIDISTSGQVINLNAIFTPASGAVLEQKCRDIDILSGLIGAGGAGGGTSINGISGTVTLDSPDESISIVTNGQSIELTTPGSGAPSGASYILVDYNDNAHLTDARKLSATSGVIIDDKGARSGSGIVLKLDFDNEPTADQILSWNGQKLAWVDDQNSGVGSGNVNTGVSLDFTSLSGTDFVIQHDLSTTKFVWDMWTTDTIPDCIVYPENVVASGINHVVVSLDTPMNGFVNLIGIVI